MTYGLGTGISSGLIYPTMMGYSASILPEKQGISSGLMAGIYEGAAIVWSPILAGSIENKGLTFTFNLIGLACLIALTGAGFILKPVPKGKAICQSDERTDGKDQHVLRCSRGICVRPDLWHDGTLPGGRLCICVLLHEHGGTHPVGAVTDHTDKYVTLNIICAISIITMGVLAVSPGTAAAITCMAFTALCYGGFGGTITPIPSNMFGVKYITENYGVMYLMFGIAGLIGPRAAVKLNVNGDYSKAFLVGSVMSILSLASVFIVRKK